MPANNKPLINGKAYAWANVEMLLGGVPVVGISKIAYSDTEDKQNNHGAGKFPIERAEGNYSAEASITLKASEAEAIAAKSPNGRLQDFGVFDIIVQFLVGTTRVTHKIRNCEFTNNGRDMNQGDTKIETEFKLIVSHIEWK